MRIVYFNYTDIDGDDIKIEINFDILRVRVFAITYNFNGEIISRNKIVGWYNAKNKNKLFKILRNMSYKTREEYLKFIDELEM